MWKTRALFAALGLALLITAGQDAVAAAGPFSVDGTDDGVDANPGDGVCQTADGRCTLRAAIMETNALPGADTINVPARTYTLSIAGAGEDASASGDLDISDDLVISGGGAAETIIDAAELDRVFQVLGGVVTISGATIRGGRSTDLPGGGIASQDANLTLDAVTVEGNRSDGDAGGIYSSGGDLTIRSSVITSNEAPIGDAGGIFNAGGNLTLAKSVVEWNIAGVDGGGVHNTGSAVITNVVFSDNAAQFYGGGINNRGEATLTNVTFSNNRADFEYGIIPGGGGIHNLDGSVQLQNSIVAHSQEGGNCVGVITSRGHNLEDTDDCGFGASGDLTYTDPGLSPADESLVADSPAIDAAGDAACPLTDRRGYIRPADGDGDGTALCDIGAFEFGASPPARGDANCDRHVDSVDALFALRYAAGFEVAEDCFSAGDVNCDGAIDFMDALGILRYVAALPPLPQNEPCPDVASV